MWIGRKTIVLDCFCAKFDQGAPWYDGPLLAISTHIKRGWHPVYPVRYVGNIGEERLQSLQLSLMLLRYVRECGYQKLFDKGWIRTADNFGLLWTDPNSIRVKKLADGEKLEGVEWVILGEIDHRIVGIDDIEM